MQRIVFSGISYGDQWKAGFWGMAAEKESAETQTGAAGAYYEEDAFTVLLETEYAEKKFL